MVLLSILNHYHLMVAANCDAGVVAQIPGVAEQWLVVDQSCNNSIYNFKHET